MSTSLHSLNSPSEEAKHNLLSFADAGSDLSIINSDDLLADVPALVTQPLATPPQLPTPVHILQPRNSPVNIRSDPGMSREEIFECNEKIREERPKGKRLEIHDQSSSSEEVIRVHTTKIADSMGRNPTVKKKGDSLQQASVVMKKIGGAIQLDTENSTDESPISKPLPAGAVRRTRPSTCRPQRPAPAKNLVRIQVQGPGKKQYEQVSQTIPVEQSHLRNDPIIQRLMHGPMPESTDPGLDSTARDLVEQACEQFTDDAASPVESTQRLTGPNLTFALPSHPTQQELRSSGREQRRGATEVTHQNSIQVAFTGPVVGEHETLYDPGLHHFRAMVTPLTHMSPSEVTFEMRRARKIVHLQWDEFRGSVAASGTSYLCVNQTICNLPRGRLSFPIYIVYRGLGRHTHLLVDPFDKHAQLKFALSSDGTGNHVNLNDEVIIAGSAVEWIAAE